MNILDIVLLLLFIPGIVRGLSKGFLEQAVSLVGIFASAWVAFRFSDRLIPFLATHIPATENVLHLIAFGIILVVCLIVVLILANLLTRIVEMAMLGWLNKLLGLILGVAVSALIIGLLIVVFDSLNARFNLVTSPILQESFLYPLLRDAACGIFPYLKELILGATSSSAAGATALVIC